MCSYGMFLAGLTRDDQFNSTGMAGGNAPTNHLDRSVFTDFEIWGVRDSGILTAYAQGFEFHDMVIVGDPENPNNGEDSRGHDAGILIHKVNHNVIIDGVRIEGFHTGLNVGQGGGQGYNDIDPMDLFVISNVTLANNIENFTPSAGRTGASPTLHPGFMENPPFNPYAQLTGSFDVDASASSFDPVADIVVTRIDANGFYLDASGSFDPDYQQDAQLAGREVFENSIAFFQWDFDGDGVADTFGRDVAVYFTGLTSHEISLTLTDAQGAQTTTTVLLTPGDGMSRQLLDDGGFDLAGSIYDDISTVVNARIETGPDAHAWGARHFNGGDFTSWLQVDGHAQVNGPAATAKILDQLVADRAEHWGLETFAFDVQYDDRDGRTDSLIAEVWGINGLPEIPRYAATAPIAAFSQEPFTANLLYSSGNLLVGGDFDWQRIEGEVDFGAGYDYVYVRFVGNGIDASLGDIVAIDNVSLGGREVTVDENLPPTITSPAAAPVLENQTEAIDVDATDDGGAAGLSYSLTGGTDRDLFSIDAGTGLVSFLAAPDFEAPGDAGGDNVYDLQVTVTDGHGASTAQNIQITVLDVEENTAPTITSAARAAVLENQTEAIDVDATDDGGAAGLSYSLTGGTDRDLFSIDAGTGLVSFLAAPDFEAPGDAGGDNVYDLQVTVTDGHGASTAQNIQITVLDIEETPEPEPENQPPVITSGTGADVSENQTIAIDVDATDDGGAEASGTASASESVGLVYSLTGGADHKLFTIDPSTGLVSFIAAPDFENPGDAGRDNVYDIQVTVTDANGASTSQDIRITVLDVEENTAPVITSAASTAVFENQTTAIDVNATDDGGAAGLSYSLTGGTDQALFSIDAATGLVSFIAAPDFENPGDAGGDNIYDIQVTVTDLNGASVAQNIQIEVLDQDENQAPTITSAASAEVFENQTTAIDVNATDDSDSEGAG